MRQSFKIHLTFYLLVNLFLVGVWAASGGGNFWPVWSILAWGLAVAVHGAVVFHRVGVRPTRTEGPTSVHEMESSAGLDRQSLRPATAPDGTVTILFTDIEASSQLNERLGDVRWLELLRAHHAIVRDEVHQQASRSSRRGTGS